MTNHTNMFASIWIVVCCIQRCGGNKAQPVFVVALDTSTGKITQIGMPKLEGQRRPPYPTGPQALLVTVLAEDLGLLHLALGWRQPARVIDLAVEFRNATNGKRVVGGPGLAGACIWYGLPSAGAITASVPPDQVRRRLDLITGLFHRMKSTLDWGRALLRGRYLLAVAHIEMNGMPIDASSLIWLSENWRYAQKQLVLAVDEQSDCYSGGRFQVALFKDFLARRGIEWPRNSIGALDLSDNVFRDFARLYPDLIVLKELRATLANFQPASLQVGDDKRNRTPLRPFASRTGRNQPSTKAWLLGGPSWTRFLIRPEPGRGLALIDWEQQEFGIAAALSGDRRMQASYMAGDPYIAFAIQARAAPEGATAETHHNIRNQFKTCALGVQYGMGSRTLGRILNIRNDSAKELIERHKRIFPKFWQWSNNIETSAMLRGSLRSVFGWQVAVEADANPRFLRNFPMQANGAEMLRLACCLATESGIRVCAPLHDALLIEAPLHELESTVAQTQRLMAEASAVVLDGFELRSEARVVRYPDRLGNGRSIAFWSIVEKLIKEGTA
ncbi:MAG: DNA polymerase [Pseudomonadota bacterium]